MSEDRKAVRISGDHYDQVMEIAEERGIGLGDALDVVLGYGISRINTLSKYNGKVKKEAKKAAKEASAKKAAKKSGAKKAPKRVKAADAAPAKKATRRAKKAESVEKADESPAQTG